ncbi:cadherin-related family member 4 [Petaurus breviceps papuanus]|uniref:cadherin-related family member 4 n=1 Tax=Petaurus breviceps papuanus TaxID=3040969 RepID=UPI0036DC3782
MKQLYLGGLIFALEMWGALGLLNFGECKSLVGGLVPSLTDQSLRGLLKLPWTVNISEAKEPGSVIHIFSFNCSCPATVELNSVKPPSSFFNQPSLFRHDTQYLAQVTLSSAARLDARQVNHYQLDLKVTCGESIWNLPLSVEVFKAQGPPICWGRFASPAGDKVQVLETVEPQSLIYVVLLRRGLTGVKMEIMSSQDTRSFSIDEWGQVLTPSQGLVGSAYKHFQLKILVADGQGKSCQGTLTVEVLPNPSNKISFGTQFQTFNISEDLEAGGVVGQVRANGSRVRYQIIELVPYPLYAISSVDGLIWTTAPLDLGRNPGAAVTEFQVKAYDPFQPSISAQLSVIVNVQPTNTWAPRCTPALLVTEVPETIPVGSILMTLVCSDPDSISSTFHYKLWHHETKSNHSFRLQGPVLQVNSTLDYDSIAPNAQYRATILVTDSGQPPQTSEVPVLVTVTPVNEYSPICPAHKFLVREDALRDTLVGTVLGSDRDYPPNSIEYHISDSSANFYIDPHSGQLHLLGSLDYEKQKTYMLVIFLTDRDQDQNSTHHRSGSCTITIEVQNVNEHVPECEPPFQELTISPAPSTNAEVTRLTCSDQDMPEQAPGAFSFAIVGGNSNGRFYMRDNILFHNVFSFQPDGLDSYTYELLVRVTDKGPTLPLFSTTAIVIIHVIPWITTMPTTSTKPPMISSPTPLLVTRIEDYWAPEAWFVVVLTVTGVLLFTIFAWLLCRWLGRKALSQKTHGQSSQSLLSDSIRRNENSAVELNKKKNDEVSSILSLVLPNLFQSMGFKREGSSSNLMAEPRTLLQAEIISSVAAQEHGAGSETNLNSMEKSCFKKLVAVLFWKWVRYIKGIQADSFPCLSHTLLTPYFPRAPPFLFSYHHRP